MTEQSSHVVVGDDTDRSRYEAHIGDHLAGVLAYADDEETGEHLPRRREIKHGR